MPKLTQNGFTLIELLVVIAIIGVLTSLLLANMVGIRERGSDTKLKNDLRQFKTALRLYYNDNQVYPSGNGIACTSGTFTNADGDFTSGSGSIYMRDIDQAFADANCSYTQRNGGNGFLLQVELDNEGDPDTTESANRCGKDPAEGIYYQCAD